MIVGSILYGIDNQDILSSILLSIKLSTNSLKRNPLGEI